jgi:hypothetical protein
MSSPDQIEGIDLDILNGFREESRQLLNELTQIVEALERPSATFPTQALEDYSQRIDRIMGAAKTLLLLSPDHIGLQSIGKISEICKSMGYRAANRGIPAMIPIFAAFWMDVIEVLSDLLDVLDNREKTISKAKEFCPVLQRRLEWLLQKVDGAKGAPEKVHGAGGAELKDGDQITADVFSAMLKDLGIH